MEEDSNMNDKTTTTSVTLAMANTQIDDDDDDDETVPIISSLKTSDDDSNNNNNNNDNIIKGLQTLTEIVVDDSDTLWKQVKQNLMTGRVDDSSSSSSSRHDNHHHNNKPSPRRHVHADLMKYGAKPLVQKDGPLLVGIQVGNNYQITTHQGPMGHSTWFDQATTCLESMAQPLLSLSSLHHNNDNENNNNNNKQRRQLAMPEMVFPMAHVTLEYNMDKNTSTATTTILSWDAMDGLKAWAECHQGIPLPGNTTTTTTTTSSTTGVSILQTKDAALWKQKSQQQQQKSRDNEQISSGASTTAPVISSTTFHYDWTFSSPYSGTTTTTNCGNHGQNWIPTANDEMPYKVLLDQSIPILYYDACTLWEDDLHDNGICQAGVKIRVMPCGAYVKYTLFVRVDDVLVRYRDTKLYMDFMSGVVFRNIDWKECAWQDLSKHQVPTSVAAWRWESGETPALQALLNQLPSVPSLPSHMHRHAKLYLSTSKS